MKFSITIKGLRFLEGETSSFNPETLLPVPQVITADDNICFSLNDKLTLNSNLPEESNYIFDIFKQELALQSKITFITVNNLGTPFKEKPSSLLDLIPRELLHLYRSQGYYLETDIDKISINADEIQGIFYGLITLLQVIDYKEMRIPKIKILDWPSMEIRGVSDENARGQAGSLKGLKNYVRFLGLLKMNVLQMNLEDMFRSKKHPKSSDEERGCYSMEEMQELSEFASKYFVEVTPIQSTCGHLDNLFYLPEYKHLAEFEHVATCYDLSNPEIYPYIKDIVHEEVEAWNKSKSFHMACDESWDVGKGRSKKYIQERGIGNAYLVHYTKCYEIIRQALEKKHGKGNIRIFIYQDILINHEEVLAGLPRENLVIDIWQYSPREKYPQVNTILDYDLSFIVSPSVMDYQRMYPSVSKSEKNIINLITYAYKSCRDAGKPELFLGQINTSWGDFRNENFRDLRMYGYALSGAVAWNVEPWLDFTNKIHAHYKSLKSFKTAYYKQIFGIDDINSALELEQIVHGIEDKKDFRSWFGYNLLFNKLWTHPLQPLRSEKTKKYPIAIKSFQRGIQICKDFKKKAIRFPFVFDAMEMSLKMHEIYCRKTLLKRELKGLNPVSIAPEKKMNLISELDALIGEFSSGREEYERVWTINCKHKCLDFMLDEWDWMVNFLSDLKNSLENSRIFTDPFIPSEYIYTDYDTLPGQTITFRKTFKLNEIPEKAFLQAFAANHADISLNGNAVGFTQYRTTLSYMLLEHCVKWWDITKFLQPGENVLEFTIINNTGGWCLLNCYVEITDSLGKKQRVVSDKTWHIWVEGEEAPPKLKSLGKPPSVIGGLTFPDFSEGKRSHFTTWLGRALELPAFLPSWTKSLMPFLIWLAKKLKITM